MTEVMTSKYYTELQCIEVEITLNLLTKLLSSKTLKVYLKPYFKYIDSP